MAELPGTKTISGWQFVSGADSSRYESPQERKSP
jgi:hypothetical protein